MPSMKDLKEKEEFKTMYAAFKNATEGANARARRAISDVYAAYDIILLSCIICVALGFVWLLLLK
jgi:cytochrome c556